MYTNEFLVRLILLSSLCTRLNNALENGSEVFPAESEEMMAILKEPWDAVIIDLENSSLNLAKNLWKRFENTYDHQFRKTILAAFNSKGLEHKSGHYDISSFLRAIANLKSVGNDSKATCFTLHTTVKEIVQTDLKIGGSILLMTGLNSEDEDLCKATTELLNEKSSSLSVLWLSNKEADYLQALEEVTRKTGGRFIVVLNVKEINYVNEPDFESEQIFGEEITNHLMRIRFPEKDKEGIAQQSNEPILRPGAGIQTISANFFSPLIVEVASGAILDVRPGFVSRIPFTVKNNLNTPVSVVFGAKLNNVPQIIEPQRAILQPSTTITIVVTLQVPSNMPTNTLSTVTFSALLQNTAYSRTALVSFVPHGKNDRSEPKVNYKYEGDCKEFMEPQTCEHGTWSLEVTAQDEDSGLLKILSEPYGLLFKPNFIAGTTQPVIAYYSSTCCHPKVDIWVEDLRGNYVKRSFDVINQNLLAGEIAAIVVGVLLLLFIIIAIIVIAVLVKRRNQRNLIIPRSRTESR